MNVNWPFVSRARYESLEWELRRVRLDRDVLVNEVAHLKESRLSLVRSLAKAARELKETRHECEAWHAEAIR